MMAATVFLALQLTGCGNDAPEMNAEDVKANVAPIGKVILEGETEVVAEKKAAEPAKTEAAAPAGDLTSVYQMKCFACHGTGAAGAPLMGNKEQWAKRIAKGMDVLYKSSLEGLPGTAMAAKGGFADLSDDQVKSLVDYMVEKSK